MIVPSCPLRGLEWSQNLAQTPIAKLCAWQGVVPFKSWSTPRGQVLAIHPPRGTFLTGTKLPSEQHLWGISFLILCSMLKLSPVGRKDGDQSTTTILEVTSKKFYPKNLFR